VLAEQAQQVAIQMSDQMEATLSLVLLHQRVVVGVLALDQAQETHPQAQEMLVALVVVQVLALQFPMLVVLVQQTKVLQAAQTMVLMTLLQAVAAVLEQ
jgi:hypothetical protein